MKTQTLRTSFTKAQYDRGLELAREKKTRLIAQIRDDVSLTPDWLVSSSTRGEGYIVNRERCNCTAHMKNGHCRHRAWLWYRMSKMFGFTIVFSDEPVREEVAA